ncbi:hypothetical protein UFOVP599_44 [uncultured Caudovirales phage]|uniref:Uncharacterized protein n=1 Tax=uncultured Caudovirales phage TaxID=2100421 RepID=A0A6J5N3V2_9CAUD|nr:hypothetical protein UFOVP599_44 [uncultured Caudovirales phage]
MDEFSQFLMGGQAQTKTSPPPQTGGVNPYNVGNLRPPGSSTGFQQPTSYEEGIKSLDNQLKIYGEKHGIKTLRQALNRYAPPSENKTNDYVNYVAQRTGLNPDQEIDFSNPAVRHVISGPMILMEKGNKAIFGGKTQAAQSAPTGDEFSQFLMGGKSTEAPASEKATPEKPSTQLKPKMFGQAEGMENQTQGFFDKFAERSKKATETQRPIAGSVASLADTVAGVVPGTIASVAYPVARAFQQSPEEATKIAQTVSEPFSQPFGKALGVTEEPAYKQEFSRRAMEAVGQYIGESADAISAKTGIPKQDVESMINTIATGVGAKLPKATEALPKLKEQFEKAFPKMEEPKPTAPAGVEPAMAGVGAAKTEINPYYGKVTGEEVARGQYPTVKLSKIKEDVAPVEQATRADIANEILGNTGQVRTGVITGNENTLRQEYTEARSANPTPKSELLRKQIADEQNALTRYADQRVEATGASKNLPTDYERGQLMNDAIAGDEGLTGYLKQAKQSLYDEARAKVGDNPIQSSSVNNLLENKQFRAGLGLKGNEGVAKSAEQLIELAKTVGFEDKAGNVLPPNSISAWKAVREALNSEWTKDNASTIGKINAAIDKDIALAGGQDLYKKADNLHKAEKKIFESKGIKTLFGEVDPNGVQTATSFEAIPKKLNQMPVDQWKHIYDTYDEISKGRVRGGDFDLELTPELIDYANAAKAEMRGALAREIYQAGAGKAGVWNQNDVNKILNARAKKIEHAFSPEEQRAFHTLNYAGHIMPGVHAYEGAALQGQRVNKFAEKLPMIGRTAGAMTRVPFAESAGAWAGEKAAKFTIGKSERKQATKLQEEMTKNSQKSIKLKDIGKE